MFDDLARDLRFAARTLARTPAFSLVAVLTLTLGIGATTAMFSVVDGVLLRDLPFLRHQGSFHVTVARSVARTSKQRVERGGS